MSYQCLHGLEEGCYCSECSAPRQRFRNLTPHDIHICGLTGEIELTIPRDPAGPARVSVTAQPIGSHAGITLARPSLGEVTDLPAPKPGVLLIVSLMVQQARPDRTDLVVPGELLRDERGQPIGCWRLHVAPEPSMAPSQEAVDAVQAWCNLRDTDRRDAIRIIREPRFVARSSGPRTAAGAAAGSKNASRC